MCGNLWVFFTLLSVNMHIFSAGIFVFDFKVLSQTLLRAWPNQCFHRNTFLKTKQNKKLNFKTQVAPRVSDQESRSYIMTFFLHLGNLKLTLREREFAQGHKECQWWHWVLDWVCRTTPSFFLAHPLRRCIHRSACANTGGCVFGSGRRGFKGKGGTGVGLWESAGAHWADKEEVLGGTAQNWGGRLEMDLQYLSQPIGTMGVGIV